MVRARLLSFAAPALVLWSAMAGPAMAYRSVEAPAPYVNVCSLAAAEVAGVPWSRVLPGPSFAAPRGMEIKLLAGGRAMTCHISNGFHIIGVWFD